MDAERDLIQRAIETSVKDALLDTCVSGLVCVLAAP